MKKIAALLAAFIMLASNTPAQALTIAGARCPKAGASRTVRHAHFTCAHRGSKLVWKQSKRSSKPASAPTPATTATTPVPSDTPTLRARTLTDQPDLVTGFQIKPFYVVPSDGTDRHLDTNGTLDSALTEGNAFLQQQTGYHLQIDQRADGYDIQYLHSKYTMAQLSVLGADRLLMAEAHVMDDPGPDRKHFLFFIDVPFLSDGASNACGFGETPGLTAEVAVAPGRGSDGTVCTGSDRNFKSVTSALWVHEVLHTFGVTHTLDDACDVMTPALGACSTAYAIDAKRTRYVGASAQGVDLLSLRVWADHVTDPGLRAGCDLPSPTYPRTDGRDYAYCATGTQQLGELMHCWSPTPTAQLQALVDGVWTALGSPQWSAHPWGTDVRLDCGGGGFTAASTMVTVTTPGVVVYRWLVDGRVDESFNVIWAA